jgi:hypothetical protein
MDARGASTTADVRFDALLRALLSWGLVERPSEATGPSWKLSPLAQERLESFACPPPRADKVIYFGHHCVTCGELRPTKYRSGRFMCESCREREDLLAPDGVGGLADGDVEYPVLLPPPRRHHLDPSPSVRVRVLELSGSAADAGGSHVRH